MTDQSLKVGEKAPDFTLQDQDGNDVSLSDFRGQKVILSWHPLAWTGACRTQMENLEDSLEEFEDLNAVALGLSVDSAPSKKAWAEDMGLENTRLLADFYPHGEVAQAYGIFNKEFGASQRAVFVLDEEGIVRWKKVYPGGQVPDTDEILDAVEEI